jgi:hypothetical protein
LFNGRRILVYFFIAWLLVSAGCNYPGLATQSPELPPEALRQTLAARSTGTLNGELTPGPPLETLSPTEISGPAQGTLPASSCGQLIQNGAFYQYCAQSGDTLTALEGRFDVEPGAITSWEPIPQEGFIQTGQVLYIPNTLAATLHGGPLLPDSEAINSPSAAGFNLSEYVSQAGGFLSSYSEMVDGERMSGAQIAQLVVDEFSISPRLLLTFLEYRSGWVMGQPKGPLDYPIGFYASGQKGLYKELAMVGTHFTIGYYGWRSGDFTQVKFKDGRLGRLNPLLAAGSAGVQNLFAKFYEQDTWLEALYGEGEFIELYVQMFDDPWARAAPLPPAFFPGMAQPELALPFLAEQRWSLTAGPHEAWRTGSPRGALDLAPVTGEAECAVSLRWATAVAPGVIVRSGRSAVVLDLDGDGFEGTGWTILYYHIAEHERIAAGARVALDDPLGHPSCEGGRTTGTHLHIARKYNGEWIAADGPLPFMMSGWRAYADERNYYGELRKGDQVAVASPVGPGTSIVTR